MREKEYLKQSFSAIFSATGAVLALASTLFFTPLFFLIAYPLELKDAPAFLIPSVSLLLIGLFSWRIFKNNSGKILSVQEGGVIVLLGWTIIIIFCAFPFMIITRLDFSRAVFESVSAWTTTGLSVVDVTKASKMILFWRSILQLAGGAGLAIITLSAIVKSSGTAITNAEGRSEQLVPHVKKSARLVMVIYISYAIAGTAAYMIAGMTFFDAINHSFTAISTGGFSTRPESIGYWNSPFIEAISIVLMLLGNLSFVTAWFLFQGRFKTVFRNSEVRLMMFLIPFSAATVFILTSQKSYPQVSKAIRVALFETISALTTTGFSTVTYQDWNSYGLLVLIILMLIGGGTYSTAGGIKQFRIYYLWKLLLWEFKGLLNSKNTVIDRPVWEGDRQIYLDDTRIKQVCFFITLYLLTYLVSTAILCIYGYSLRDSLFECASAIGDVGLSIGVTSATMQNIPLWTLTIAMYLGRLEITVLIVSLLKLFLDGGKIIRLSLFKKQLNAKKNSR